MDMLQRNSPSPTPQIYSVTASKTSTCDEYIVTDDVRRLFVVLWAPLEAKLTNYSTTTERSSLCDVSSMQVIRDDGRHAKHINNVWTCTSGTETLWYRTRKLHCTKYARGNVAECPTLLPSAFVCYTVPHWETFTTRTFVGITVRNMVHYYFVLSTGGTKHDVILILK